MQPPTLRHPPASRAPAGRRLPGWTAGLLALALVLPVHAEMVEGEVRKVEADTGKITLRHGEIKSLNMPAMQMVYRVAQPEWLTQVQAGDKVRFSAEKLKGQYTITELVRQP